MDAVDESVEGGGGGGLTTIEIDDFLRNYFTSFKHRIHYLGTFPFDQFPHQKFTQPLHSYALCCVVNIDPSYKPGQHWVAFFREKDSKEIEFFDSYGYPPSSYKFEPFSQLTSVSNTFPLQSNATNVCGHYCILFLLFRFASINLLNVQKKFLHVMDFLRHLSPNSQLNRDISIKRIYEKNRTRLSMQIHFTLLPTSSRKPIQRSYAFQAQSTGILSNAHIDSV